ncbi:MAG: bifunctional alpha,alpha-trehalose-phosphate synthase (UDP-forming)/trehalose-phosphatase [Polyangiaceae bacterium]
MRGRLLIVSNRLPFTLQEERGQLRLSPSAGGLATALRGPHEESGGLWFGWPGDFSRVTNGKRANLEDEMRRRRAVPIHISPGEVSRYYDGFSNSVLWPLFHYLLDKVQLDAESDWTEYQQINRRFAEAVAAEYRAGDAIWVHDYQLALVPGYLRAMLPEAPIGFFLHVPFPSADVFRILPWREEILRGLLGADLVGFHTSSYRHNFAHAAALVLGVELGTDALVVDDRVVRIGVHPISIDARAFTSMAAHPDVTAVVESLRAETAGKRIVLGIDRLDYTKGIPRRLLAIDRLLTSEPSLRDSVHFVQIAVPSRERVDAYGELRRTVNELVGRLNGHHGTPAGAPIQLLYRSIAFEQIVALYRAADVMLVTPLRDGMNLVAKEYVASRIDERGVLVLSELAGAAAELPEALTVNPYDLSATAAAIARALHMSPREQEVRMRPMRERLFQNDVHAWAARFLADLRPEAPRETRRESGRPSALVAEMHAVRRAPARLLMLDYDGTLVPLAPMPDLATPDDQLLDLLRELAALPQTDVHIVTGRTRASIERWLGHLSLHLHAEHGFWSLREGVWTANGAVREEWKGRVAPLLAAAAASMPGAMVEEKSTALALHYRGAEPTLVADRLRELRPTLREALRACSSAPEILEGSKVLEVRQHGVGKGLLARRLLAQLGAETRVIAAGDDRTDEDMFAALPPDAISIHVGVGWSAARYRVATPAALRSLLAAWQEA